MSIASLVSRSYHAIFDIAEGEEVLNKYHCPHCERSWATIWDCGHNDYCPQCGTKDIQPYDSETIVHDFVEKQVQVAPDPRGPGAQGDERGV